MTGNNRLPVVIIGGAGNGVVLAHQLLLSGDPHLRVILFDIPPALSHLGTYATNNPGDLAAPDQDLGAVPDERSGRLRIMAEDVLALGDLEHGVEVRVGNGTSMMARAVILVVDRQNPSQSDVSGPQDGQVDLNPMGAKELILVAGTGLSAIEAWYDLSLFHHRGHVTIVSGSDFPAGEGNNQSPLELDAADVPFGTNLIYFVKWFRSLLREAKGRGRDWRDVVDGLRPHAHRLWTSWTDPEKRRFTRHLCRLWDASTQRLPTDLYEAFTRATSEGRVTFVTGQINCVRNPGQPFKAVIQYRGTSYLTSRD